MTANKRLFFLVCSLLMSCTTLVAQTLNEPASNPQVERLTSEKREALEEFQRRMRVLYIDPIIGEKVATALEISKTRLLAIESRRTFAQSFTRLVQNVSKDKHLTLSYATSSPGADQVQSKSGHPRNITTLRALSFSQEVSHTSA